MREGREGEARGQGDDVLSFPDALDHSVPAVAHDDAGKAEEGSGAEALGGEVALGELAEV
jgi:hypothetical protein